MKQIPLELQKMEMLGRLSASVIHDLNNMLTVIQLNAALLETGGFDEEEQAKLVGEINRACVCAAGLTGSVLKFSRRDASKTTRFEVGKALPDIAPLLLTLTGKRATLTTDYAPGEFWLEGSVMEFQQIILNLVTNAVDSQTKAGVKLIVQGAEEDGREYVEISVQDWGKGVSEENLANIFEPFFTTKEQGQGTGLGLYIVRRIVHDWNGALHVESVPGEGSIFRVRLPASAPAEPEVKVAKEKTEVDFRGVVLLLVEDDPGVLAIGRQILERKGARVLAAENATEAAELWQKHRDEIGLLFTDLILPGEISGDILARDLCRDKTELRVLYTSGNEEAFQNLEPVAHGVFLPKPYRPEALIEAVAKLVAS